MLGTFVRGCALACGIGLLVPSGTGPAEAEVIVDSSGPFRLGTGLPGSQSAPSITPFGGNGSIATWLGPGGSNQYPFVGYYSIYGDQRQILKLQSAGGPTTGARATSTAVVSFADASALIFFAAAPRTGPGQDIFAQRMSAYRERVGAPVLINRNVANIQEQIFAARLTGGNVLVTWLTHGTAAASFNLRGRVVNTSAGGSFAEVAVTADTAGAQTQTGLAALTNGNSVIAYFVRTGAGATARQIAYLQRLGPTGARLGAPKLIKQTTGPNTYGGVGVAALPGGRYIAIWFVPASDGRAALKSQIFQANGAAGAISTIGTASIKPTSQAAPKAIFSEDGVLVAFDAFAAPTYGVVAILLNNSGALIAAAKVLGSGNQPLVTTSLAFDSVSDIYYLTWTQKLPSSARAFGDSFYVSQGCTVKC